MKKILSILLTALLLALCSTVFFGCEKACEHNYEKVSSQANCLNAGSATYECTLCGETKQEEEQALGHTTNDGVCSRCGEFIGTNVWKLSYFLDQNNNPTNEACVENKSDFVGTFTTENYTSELATARFFISDNKICVKLWQFGDQEVSSSSSKYFTIVIKDDNGASHYADGEMKGHTNYLSLDAPTFVSLLQENQDLEMQIIEDGYVSFYGFKIINGNFNTVYSSMNG